MFEGLKARWTARQLRHQATQLVKDRQGFAGKPWPLTAITSDADRAALATEIRGWLDRQLSATATPYGIATYLVGLCYVTQIADQRTPLAKESWDIPTRVDAPVQFDLAEAAIRSTVPPPATTHIEVYLLSMGNIVKAQLDRTH